MDTDDQILAVVIKKTIFNSAVKVGLIDALKSLKPNARGYTCNDAEGILRWDGDENEQPSLSELESERDRLQLVYENTTYKRQRQSAYDSVGDQLDMIYKDMKNSTTTHADAVEAVKTKYPKE